ncbi:hypothetical protein D0865_07368 [Hortaea werneckii]|uniref:Uncharacterized protein n=1 Tax=Hortaea werneckii TaxID=91943 RepID=A0A3M7CD42_HORWE|nr:hypothetical protein D0865_07368 [Hortaea werneckii]
MTSRRHPQTAQPPRAPPQCFLRLLQVVTTMISTISNRRRQPLQQHQHLRNRPCPNPTTVPFLLPRLPRRPILARNSPSLHRNLDLRRQTSATSLLPSPLQVALQARQPPCPPFRRRLNSSSQSLLATSLVGRTTSPLYRLKQDLRRAHPPLVSCPRLEVLNRLRRRRSLPAATHSLLYLLAVARRKTHQPVKDPAWQTWRSRRARQVFTVLMRLLLARLWRVHLQLLNRLEARSQTMGAAVWTIC